MNLVRFAVKMAIISASFIVETMVEGSLPIKYIYQGNDRIILRNEVAALTSIDSVLDAFAGDVAAGRPPELHAYAPPFVQWTKTLPMILRHLNRHNVRLFVSWASGAPYVVGFEDTRFLNGKQRETLRNFVKRWRPVDIQACIQDTCLNLLYQLQKNVILRSLPEATSERISGEQVTYLIRRMSSECQLFPIPKQPRCYLLLEKLPSALITKYAILIATLLGDRLRYVSLRIVELLIRSSKCVHT